MTKAPLRADSLFSSVLGRLGGCQPSRLELGKQALNLKLDVIPFAEQMIRVRSLINTHSQMSLRWKLLIAGCAVLAVVTWVVILCRPKAPSYEGKSIAEWLASFDTPSGLSQVQYQQRAQKRSEATLSLRQMGPEVYPYLRRMLQPDSAAAKLLQAAAREIRRDYDQPGLPATLSPEEVRMRRAVEACAALGRDAQTMTPDLLLVLKSNSYSNVRSRAAYALGEIGGAPDKVVPALIQSLSNRVDGNILISLGKYGADAVPAVPTLVGLLDAIQKNVSEHKAFDRYALCEAAWALHLIAPQEAEKRLRLLREVLEQERDPSWQSRLSKVVETIGPGAPADDAVN